MSWLTEPYEMVSDLMFFGSINVVVFDLPDFLFVHFTLNFMIVCFVTDLFCVS